MRTLIISMAAWLCLLASGPCGMAQQGAGSIQPVRLTIWEAYRLAREHYPSSRRRDLIALTKQYTVENAAHGYLPQLSFSGQATEQSAVTNIPIKVPGFSLPAYSRDQYKVYGEIDQVVYDGGLIRNQQDAARVEALIDDKNLDVELHAVYDRIDQLYFGALLLDDELAQNELLQQDIRNALEKTRAMAENGTAYPAALDEPQAQLLQAGQSRTGLDLGRTAYLDMLSLLTGATLDPRVPLAPPPDLYLDETITRPELLLFEYQKRNYDLQEEMAASQLRPRLGLFLQGGYARPGLNMLSNDFAWYYIGGVRLTWTFGNLYTLKRTRMLAETGRRSLDVQKETFILNTRLQQRQTHAAVVAYATQMHDDDKIIRLRTSVKNAALAQLSNGVLSTHDYLTQVIAEDQAKQAYILHRVQWLQSEYDYQMIVGH